MIPFEELGSEAEEGYFSDGLTKDINGFLSQFTNLFVFAPGSVSAYRQNAECETIPELV